MNFWKKITKTADEPAEDEGYNGYGYDEDDGVVGVPDYGEEDHAGKTVPASNVQTPADKVSLKLVQPKSHTEATKVADKLMSGCIVVLDIGELQRDSKESVLRLLDFIAGVIYVLNGQMIRTNKTTIVLAPNGVDISGFEADAENAQ